MSSQFFTLLVNGQPVDTGVTRAEVGLPSERTSQNIISQADTINGSLEKLDAETGEELTVTAWQDFTSVGTTYTLTLDENANASYDITTDYTKVLNIINRFQVVKNDDSQKPVRASGITNFFTNIRVVGFNPLNGEVTLSHTPSDTNFRIVYKYIYPKYLIPEGKLFGSSISQEVINASASNEAKEIEYDNIDNYFQSVDVQSALEEIGTGNKILYYNDTGSIIPAFTVLHPKSATLVGGEIIATPDLADPTQWELTQGTLAITESAIGIGETGYAVRRGRVKGGDTSGVGAGSQIWLSDTVAGGITNTKPEFPNYAISVGASFNSQPAPDGELFVSFTTTFSDTFNDGWDGAIRETFDFLVTSDGVDITGTLSNQYIPTNNLTIIFSDGFYTLDTTTVSKTLTLVAGTTTTPQLNYVFIDKATKTLQTSTAGFPTTEHAKVSVVAVFDAVTTQTNGVIRNQNVNDHIKKEDDNGHILHISERLRATNAEWASGVAPTLNGTPTNLYIATTSGQVWQLHKQSVPAQDMATGDDIHVVNDPVTPYRTTTNLNDITVYSDNATWNNAWSNIVVWGIANKTGEPAHLMANLPSAGYNTEENAIEDRNNYSNYTIPAEFKGVGFLIGRFTIRRSGTTFTYNSGTGFLDLRGFFPNNTAGGGAGSSGITEFTQLTDTPLSYVGKANSIPQVNTGETALEFTDSPILSSLSITNTITVPNYSTGWIAVSPNLRNSLIHINHGLNTTLDDLMVKFLWSPTGNDADAILLGTNISVPYGGDAGYVVNYVDSNNISIQTGRYGMYYLDNTGKSQEITSGTYKAVFKQI